MGLKDKHPIPTMISEEQIKQSTKEQIKNHIEQLQEEIDKVIHERDEQSIKQFRELVRLRVLCLLEYNKE